jgi:hypothetical protein
MDGPDHVFHQILLDLLVGHVGAVLCGNDDGIDAARFAVLIFHGHLRFAVGPHPFENLFLAHFGQTFGQSMGQHDRHRHELGRFIGGIPKHEALVAGAAGINSHGDIAGLLVDRRQDRAGVGIETPGGVRIADVLDHVANDIGNLHIGLGRDFSGDECDAGRENGFAGDSRKFVLSDDGV